MIDYERDGPCSAPRRGLSPNCQGWLPPSGLVQQSDGTVYSNLGLDSSVLTEDPGGQGPRGGSARSPLVVYSATCPGADVVPGRPSRVAPTCGRLPPPLTAGHRCAARHRDGEASSWLAKPGGATSRTLPKAGCLVLLVLAQHLSNGHSPRVARLCTRSNERSSRGTEWGRTVRSAGPSPGPANQPQRRPRRRRRARAPAPTADQHHGDEGDPDRFQRWHLATPCRVAVAGRDLATAARGWGGWRRCAPTNKDSAPPGDPFQGGRHGPSCLPGFGVHSTWRPGPCHFGQVACLGRTGLRVPPGRWCLSVPHLRRKCRGSGSNLERGCPAPLVPGPFRASACASTGSGQGCGASGPSRS
jgi:hypothetical protein